MVGGWGGRRGDGIGGGGIEGLAGREVDRGRGIGSGAGGMSAEGMGLGGGGEGEGLVSAVLQ